MYLTFEEYTAYGGTITDETAYDQYEFKARKLIDSVTSCRVQKMSAVPEAVKRCMFELIRLEQIYDENISFIAGGTSGSNSGKIISSFTNDGYTESYAIGSSNPGEYIWQFRTTTDQAGLAVIRDCLSGERDDNNVLLLYRGVYV